MIATGADDVPRGARTTGAVEARREASARRAGHPESATSAAGRERR